MAATSRRPDAEENLVPTVRMIASDVDGTILGRDGKISERTVRAFGACRDAGLEIVFVTGRPPRWLGPLREQLGHDGTVICSNGAVLYDLGAGRVRNAQTLDYAVVLEVTELIRERFPRTVFAAETVDTFHLEPGFLEAGTPELHQVEPRPLAESLLADLGPAGKVPDGRDDDGAGAGVVKLLAKEFDTDPDELLARVSPLVEHLVSVTHSSPGVALLEMARPGVNKAAALHAYTDALGIVAEEVVAFGDMPNDVQMLEWAGQGYAMSSGHRAALAATSLRAPALTEDGVARVLERLVGAPVRS